MVSLARSLFVVAFLAELYGVARIILASREISRALRDGSQLKLDDDDVPYVDLNADSGAAALTIARLPTHAVVILVLGIVMGFAGNIVATY